MLTASAWLRTKVLAAGLALAATLAPGTPAKAVDVDPGDYTAVPPGTNLALGYFLYGHRSNVNILGVGNVNARLDSAIGIGRYVRYFEVGGMLAAAQIIWPFGGLYNGSVGGVAFVPDSVTGIGDPLVALSIWPINKPHPTYSTTLGITVYESLPIGTYHNNQVLNIGENRFKTTVQAGFIQGIGPGWFVDLTGDVTFYGNNNDAFGATLSQDPSFQFQTWVRYNILKTTSVALGYSGTFGGDQYLAGVANGFKTEVHQVRAALQHFFTPTFQGQLIAARDFAVRGGFEQDFFLKLRLLQIF